MSVLASALFLAQMFQEPALVPWPSAVAWEVGVVELDAARLVVGDPALEPLAAALAEDLPRFVPGFRWAETGERGMSIDDPNAKPGPDLNWEAFLGDSPKRDFDVSRFFRWRMYEDYAGGPCTDLFPHSLSPVVSMLGVTFPSLAVATGGMFRYTEREVPDTFNMLIDYPQKITVAVLGTQGNNDPTIPGRGAGGRIPVLRGWDGVLTVSGKEIRFVPADGCKKPRQTFPIEHAENNVDHWKNLLDCAKSRKNELNAPVELGYHVQTALIMGYLAMKQGRTARFDVEKQQIVI